ncbi:hypothetical protein L596_011329 [Steinernema carpocapsae]|uniref:Uncharacterized protein n=1 Tax=Steinernema carpocapsae TaxID=34508 RepID=A0A4U5NUH6_STECR|nr:hypothetical protein L596_011329 [Steinernema carpocapsae]
MSGKALQLCFDLLRSIEGKVISGICGNSSVLELDAHTIIRFSTEGFPDCPLRIVARSLNLSLYRYSKKSCSVVFNLITDGFFLFEHLNLAVVDSVQFTRNMKKRLSSAEAIGAGGATLYTPATLRTKGLTFNRQLRLPNCRFQALGMD